MSQLLDVTRSYWFALASYVLVSVIIGGYLTHEVNVVKSTALEAAGYAAQAKAFSESQCTDSRWIAHTIALNSLAITKSPGISKQARDIRANEYVQFADHEFAICNGMTSSKIKGIKTEIETSKLSLPKLPKAAFPAPTRTPHR